MRLLGIGVRVAVLVVGCSLSVVSGDENDTVDVLQTFRCSSISHTFRLRDRSSELPVEQIGFHFLAIKIVILNRYHRDLEFRKVFCRHQEMMCITRTRASVR